MQRYSGKDSLLRYRENLSGAWQEAVGLVKNYPARFREKSLSGKFLSVAKISLIPISVALQIDMPLISQVMGTTALTSVFFLQRFKNNKHVNALSVPLAYSLAIQKAFLGAWGYAAMAGIAGTRTLVMATIPDTEEAEPLRRKLAKGFAIAGIMGVGATGALLSPWNFLPMASMLMGTVASSIINSKSHQSRALYFIANINNAFYSAVYSGSASATLIDGMAAVNNAITINETDLPKHDQKGRELSLSQRLAGYFRAFPYPENKSNYSDLRHALPNSPKRPEP